MSVNDIISKRAASEAALNEEINEGGGSRATKAYRQAARIGEFGKRAIEMETGEKVTSQSKPSVRHSYVKPKDTDKMSYDDYERHRDDDEYDWGGHRKKTTNVKYKTDAGKAAVDSIKKRYNIWEPTPDKFDTGASAKSIVRHRAKNEEALDYLFSTYDIAEEDAYEIVDMILGE